MFQGKTDEIKDHVYDVGPKAKDMFTKTTREIAEYIARSFKGGGEFINAMNPDNMGFTTLVEPPDPDITNVLALEQWKNKMKRHDDLVQTRNEISKQAFAVILGQCSQSVQDKLTARPAFANVQATTDVMSLLDMIKTSLYAGATTKNQSQTSQEALENLMLFRQGARMSNARYLEKFNELVSIVDHFGMELGVESTRVTPFWQMTLV